jgi:hypothetical protein
VFFPKLSESLHLITFAEIAVKYLSSLGYEPYLCNTEEEARLLINSLPQEGKWPCLFTNSDTTGEKDFEEFYTSDELLDMNRFENLGIIKNELVSQDNKLEHFTKVINDLKKAGKWNKEEIVNLFFEMIPNFGHKETGKYLDAKM